MKRGKPAPGGGSAKKAEKPITSFFFKQPSPAKAPAAKPSVVVDDETSASPPSKRRRGSDQEPFAAPVTQKPPTPVKPESEAPAVDAPATATRYAPAVAAVTAAALASIAPSQPDRHDRFVRKLALDHRRRDGTNRGGAEGPSDGATEGRLGADGADAHAGSSRAGEPREESHYARRPGARPSASTSSRSTQKMTPLEEQVSRHKAEHPGVLLLIEVGYKFHFYGEDARVAAKTLNIFAYQSRNYLTASVPVPRLHVYVRRLVDAGHKVGVIRQTETAALKAAGEYANDGTGTGKNASLFERKLVGLYTKSTLEAGVAVDPSGGTNDRGETAGAGDGLRTTGVLLCVAESFESSTSTRIGLAAIDASTGDVRHAEFDDTQARSGLEARLLQLSPAEVLLVEPVSAATARLVAAVFGEGKGARVERVAAASGYADARDAEKALERYGETRTRDDHGNDASLRNEKERKEESLEADGERRRMNDAPPVRGQTARAVATAFDWLKQFGLDGVSRLIRENAAFAPLAGAGDGGNTMRLSPNVIRQLELFRSSEDNHRGSLVWLLSANALTAGGARLCRSWVAHPLTDAREIRERLDAVRELAETAEPDSGGRLETLTAALRRCHGAKNAGDAERYLARVFHGTATPAELVLALGSISAFAGAVTEMAERAKAQAGDESHENENENETDDLGLSSLCQSRLLRRLLFEACDPHVAATCASLLSAVDAEAARAGRATPATALKPDDTRFPELEGTRKAVADAIADLNDLLPELRDALVRGAENTTVSGAGKQKTLSAKLGGATKGAVSLVPACLGYVTVALVEHLIELPESLEGVPHDWVRVSTNKSKKVVRYHPPAVLERAAALERARERHAGACEAAWRRFLSVECAGRFLELRGAVRAAAGLDALCSFAALARQEGYCCPTFLDADETDETSDETSGDAFLDIREGRHPILDATLIGGDSVVPNSVRLGSARCFGKRLESAPGPPNFPVLFPDISDSPYSAFSNEEENPRALVVTGPNMGGKSCFVRQTALLVLMAQCGSFTPARAMTLTPFEGVHTRMGAADNLAMGSSTFLEEMSECASILNAVTREKRSLVVLDELGRGTSTHDGVAVAHATLEHLVGARAGGSRPDGSFGEENAPSSSSSSSSRGTLTLFVTHYPSVAREVVAKRPRECAAAFTSYAEKRRTRSTTASGPEAEDETDLRAEKNADEALAAADEIDFLYALTPGVAHRSFGLNVARMAGVPPGVLRSAAAKARELETGMSRKAAARVASEARRDGGFGGAGERALLGACAEIADAAGAVVRALRDAGDVEAVAAAQARAREATREGREDVR